MQPQPPRVPHKRLESRPEHLLPQPRRHQQALLRAPVFREHHPVGARRLPLVQAVLEHGHDALLQPLHFVRVQQNVRQELLDLAQIAHDGEREPRKPADAILVRVRGEDRCRVRKALRKRESGELVRLQIAPVL